MQEVVLVVVVKTSLYMRVTQTCITTLSKLLLSSGSFLFTRAKIVGNQCDIMHCSVLEVLRHLLLALLISIPSPAIGPSAANSALRPLGAASNPKATMIQGLILGLRHRRDVALVGEVRLARHALEVETV
jgi:hypothetical protein